MRRARAGSEEVDGNRAEAAGVAADVASWRLVVCTRGGLTISGTENGRSFAPGDELDLAAAAAPGCTWREAIGDHLVEFFVPRDGEGA